MKKLQKISFNNVDVLIVDEIGSEWIKYCIPSCYSVGVLKIRGVVPYFRKISFYLFLFKRVASLGFKYKALVSAIVDEVKPKVIITFIDNDRLPGYLSDIYTKKLVISVQNGIRIDSDIDCVGQWGGSYKIPHYFGFGKHEYNLMTKKGVQIKKYYESGSLKMGLFLLRHRKITDRLVDDKNICFISQQKYRQNIQTCKDSIVYQIENVAKRVYLNTALWSYNNKFKFTIAMVHSKSDKGYNHELEFYKDINHSKNVIFQENIKSEFISYQTGIDSDIVVTILSTLGLELFGCGVKVLFCGVANSVLTKKFGTGELFRKMPEFILLNDLNKESFNAKINFLLRMDNKEYLKLTQEARSYYMNCNRPYTHELISNNIDNFIKVNY